MINVEAASIVSRLVSNVSVPALNPGVTVVLTKSKPRAVVLSGEVAVVVIVWGHLTKGFYDTARTMDRQFELRLILPIKTGSRIASTARLFFIF